MIPKSAVGKLQENSNNVIQLIQRAYDVSVINNLLILLKFTASS